ncbi:YqcI/YcgG family protein [Gluconacetobacter asukensis]|uniref:YqcI/YcgG family protein n=1 Tax=Gluconacetobacter asukensis TaxID=1017181 RepID=A0A7W4J2C6_9PROT|nr:YqcI/YcgG family protein [Gluconacetobacter asukensis]MBB2173435.1 YqcI/YcgG family protein [Gluconacetobacter asukensis]
MTRLYLSRHEAERKIRNGNWENLVFSEFKALMESSTRAFPCVFGIAGYRQDQLRYLFLEDLDVNILARELGDFVENARTFGANTSLVVFTRPRPVRTIEAYYREFWLVLDQLSRHDRAEWPRGIPQQIDHPLWEFCFHGEPIFVVCNTPAHVMRQSRRSTSFMLTFQPRWVFDRILGTDAAAEAAFGTVRERLIPYDGVAPSPALGRYGDPVGREFQQYFLPDDNIAALECPFKELARSGSPSTPKRISAA